MRTWEDTPRFSDSDRERTRDAIQVFEHTTTCERLVLGGVDGSGDYPAVTYGDSFVHLTVAHGTVYRADVASGLRELPQGLPLIHVMWMAEEETRRLRSWDDSFAALAGMGISEVIERSDYRQLKSAETGRTTSVTKLAAELVRPHAADSGNIAIQLRSLGELGEALRLLRNQSGIRYLLLDGTFS